MFFYNLTFNDDPVVWASEGMVTIPNDDVHVLYSIDFLLKESGVSPLTIVNSQMGFPTPTVLERVHGQITVHVSPDQAKDDAEALIAALPEPANTKLADKPAVEAAREAVDYAVSLE